MSFQEHEVYPLYAALWREAQPAIARNEVSMDPYLADKGRDRRRGLTLLARLSPPVTEAVSAFLAELREWEPSQYYVHPTELHVTVLSLFTATEHYQPHFAKLETYRRVVAEALRDHPRFTIAFHGVTASKGVVMVQGFPQGNDLSALRDALRAALADAGLGDELDGRYRIRAAHLSALRFAAPLNDPARTSAFLAAHRETPFGTLTVEQLDLVAHDWYMSRDRLTLLDTYLLR